MKLTRSMLIKVLKNQKGYLVAHTGKQAIEYAIKDIEEQIKINGDYIEDIDEYNSNNTGWMCLTCTRCQNSNGKCPLKSNK